MKSPNSDPGQSGRTLIELLVSMAVASMVAVALGSIVILGLRLSTGFHYEDQRVYPVRDGLDMVLKDLRLVMQPLEDCGQVGRLAFILHGPGEHDLWVVRYHLDATNGRLLRTIYTDTTCNTVESTALVTEPEKAMGYQVTDFKITLLDDGEMDVLMQGKSPDNIPFTLHQTVLGRMLK